MEDRSSQISKGVRVNRGGRPNAFSEPTERLNVLLPAGMVRAIRHQALERSQTPGQVVAAQLGGAYLAVTFHLETVMPYSDDDSPQSMAASGPHDVPGYLTLDTTGGYSHFIATDAHGHTLDLSQLGLVHPRGSTTPQALAELVEQIPMELIASKFPSPE